MDAYVHPNYLKCNECKVPRKWEPSKDLGKIDIILLNVWRKSKDFSINEFKVEAKDFLKPYEGKYR